MDKYSDDRLSLAQEIRDTLKAAGYWVPDDWAGPDLITAVGCAVGLGKWNSECPLTDTGKHHMENGACSLCTREASARLAHMDDLLVVVRNSFSDDPTMHGRGSPEDQGDDWWLSVTEELPPDDPGGSRDFGCFRDSAPVLAVCSDGAMRVGYFRRWEDDDDGPSEWVEQGRDSYRLEGVAFWHPLPIPPSRPS